MAKESIWPVVRAEREALVSDLAGLEESRWSTRSLCEKWTVLDVLGHMVATAKITPPKFFAKLAGSRFSFETLVANDIAGETAGGPAATLEAFRSRVDATTRPPGPPEAMLGETIVHGEDMRRPLGISHAYPKEALVRVADFYKSSTLLIGGKEARLGSAAASRRRGMVGRRGSRGERPHPVPGAGNDGALGSADRPVRRRSHHAALTHVTAPSKSGVSVWHNVWRSDLRRCGRRF